MTSLLPLSSVVSDTEWDSWLMERRFEEADSARLEKYALNWRYYNGEHPQPLPIRTGQPDDNIIVNLARLIVDKGVAFLFGKDLTFEIQEGETTPEEDHLDAVWRRNRKMTLLAKLAMNGGVYGDAFLKMVPDGAGEGIPRLVNLDPEYVSVRTDDEDVDRPIAFLIQWTAQDSRGRGFHRREEIRLNDAGTWDIAHRIRRGRSVWEPDPDREDLTWGYEWPPIIHAQNLPVANSYYGLSDLEDLSEQRAINYIASKANRIIRYHAHPRTFARMIGRSDVQMNEDDLVILPGEKSDVWNLEMQSDLSGTLGFMDRMISWFLATARIPRIDPAQINVGALSGFALRVLYGDLLEKTELKRRSYGDMLVELNRRLLDLAGMGNEFETELHWADPLPLDTRQMRELLQFEADYQLASRETIRAELGLDHETEEERLASQEAASGNVGAMLLRNFTTQQGTVPGARIEEA